MPKLYVSQNAVFLGIEKLVTRKTKMLHDMRAAGVQLTYIGTGMEVFEELLWPCRFGKPHTYHRSPASCKAVKQGWDSNVYASFPLISTYKKCQMMVSCNEAFEGARQKSCFAMYFFEVVHRPLCLKLCN